MKQAGRGLIYLIVDAASGEDFSGYLWHPRSNTMVPISGMVQLLCRTEELMEQWMPSRAAGPLRAFGRRRGNKEMEEHVRRLPRTQPGPACGRRGEKGTFLVKILYRQNNSWQGEVTWAETNEREYFRSALELIRLIDSALNGQEDWNQEER